MGAEAALCIAIRSYCVIVWCGPQVQVFTAAHHDSALMVAASQESPTQALGTELVTMSV